MYKIMYVYVWQKINLLIIVNYMVYLKDNLIIKKKYNMVV